MCYFTQTNLYFLGLLILFCRKRRDSSPPSQAFGVEKEGNMSECGFSFLFWMVKGWCSEIQISFCSFIVPEVLVVFIISKRNFRSLVIPLPKWHFIAKRNSRKACSRKILQFVWYNRGYYFLLLLKHATRNIFRVIMSPKFLGDYRMLLFFFSSFFSSPLLPHQFILL